MTDQDLKDMQRRPLNLTDNIKEVNIWHAYKMKLLNAITLLPMSMSYTRINTDNNTTLRNVLAERSIPIVSKSDLINQRQLLSAQFRNLESSTGAVDYCNEPHKTIHLAKIDGHDTSSVQTLNANSRYMLHHILRRADYHSAIKLVWHKYDHSMVSVQSKSRIVQGTVIVDYGGIHFLSSQLPDSKIGLATSSNTWEVLKHPDTSRDVLLHPIQESNCGRFINGVRADEQHRVNCAVVKVKDKNNCIHILIVAIRDIAPGEHLFYYYGEEYLTEWIHEEVEGEFFTISKMTDLEWEDIPIPSPAIEKQNSQIYKDDD